MSNIIIKVGVALDRDVTSVLEPIRKVAKQVLEATAQSAQKSSAAQKESIKEVADAQKKTFKEQIANVAYLAGFHIRERKRIAAEDKKAGDEKIRQEEAWKRTQQSIRNNSFRMEQALREKDLKSEEAWQRRLTAIRNNSFRMEQTMREQAERAAEAARNRSLRAEERVSAQRTALAAREARQTAVRVRRFVGNTITRGAALASRTMGGPASLEDAVAMPINFAKNMLGGMGADLSFASGAGRSGEQERKAINISNMGFIANDPRNNVRVDPKTILRESRQVANEVGESTDSALDGISRFIAKTGDLATIRPMMGDLSRLSKAYAADLGDMADAAAEVSIQLGNVDNKSELVMKVLRNVAAQGKVGTVEIADLATKMSKIVASSRMFENRDVTSGKITAREGVAGNMRAFVALSQMAKMGGAASPAEQATAVQSFMSQFDKPARLAGLKGLGINPIGDSGLKKDARTLLEEAVKAAFIKSRKTGGDMGALLNAAIGDERAKKVSRPAQQMLLEKVAELKTTRPGMSIEDMAEEGIKAYRAALEKLTDSTIEHDELVASLNVAANDQLSEVQRFNNKMDELGGELAHELLPVLPQVARGMGAVAKAIADAIDFITGARVANQIKENFATGMDAAQLLSKVRALQKAGVPIPEDTLALIKGKAEGLGEKLRAEEGEAMDALNAANNPSTAKKIAGGLDRMGRIADMPGMFKQKPDGSWAYEELQEPDDLEYVDKKNAGMVLGNVRQDQGMVNEVLRIIATGGLKVQVTNNKAGAPAPQADRPGGTRSSGETHAGAD